MQRSEFEKLVREGIKKIPKKFRDKLSNVAIIIEENPSPEQIKKLGFPPSKLLLGLYEGIPQIKRGINYMALPDRITIFQKPIEKIAKSPQDICHIVKNTIWHEIAHHFGTSEKRIREIEFLRRKKL